MKRTLKLRKMGMDFTSGEERGSDCGNYRLRAEFADKDGKQIIADFSGDRIWSSLCADAGYYDENGICHPYFPLERYHRDTDKQSRYRLADILKAVNCVSAEQYDDVEIFS